MTADCTSTKNKERRIILPKCRYAPLRAVTPLVGSRRKTISNDRLHGRQNVVVMSYTAVSFSCAIARQVTAGCVTLANQACPRQPKTCAHPRIAKKSKLPDICEVTDETLAADKAVVAAATFAAPPHFVCSSFPVRQKISVYNQYDARAPTD